MGDLEYDLESEENGTKCHICGKGTIVPLVNKFEIPLSYCQNCRIAFYYGEEIGVTGIAILKKQRKKL